MFIYFAMKFIAYCIFLLCLCWLMWHKRNHLVILFHHWKHISNVSPYGAIMYFYNVFFIIFYFPNQKFISLSILSVWLWPGGGGVGGDLRSPQSGRPEKVGTPALCCDPHPPLLLGGRRKRPLPGCWFPVYFFMKSLSCVALPPFLRLISSVFPLYSAS